MTAPDMEAEADIVADMAGAGAGIATDMAAAVGENIHAAIGSGAARSFTVRGPSSGSSAWGNLLRSAIAAPTAIDQSRFLLPVMM